MIVSSAPVLIPYSCTLLILPDTLIDLHYTVTVTYVKVMWIRAFIPSSLKTLSFNETIVAMFPIRPYIHLTKVMGYLARVRSMTKPSNTMVVHYRGMTFPVLYLSTTNFTVLTLTIFYHW
ncbi:hypothetical protein F4825DRAFT_445631, partial [Nemania diffusa]